MKRDHGGRRLLHSRDVIDFSSNVNCFGPPQKALEVLQHSLAEEISSYPDPEYPRLKEALAAYTGRKATEIFLGNGSVEIFFWITHVLKPKRTLVFSPGFCEYHLAAESTGSRVVECFLDSKSNFFLNFKEARKMAALADLIFVGNPNNPTGNLFRKEDLLEMAHGLKKGAVLVVDEAFMDFCENREDYTLLPQVNENIWVVRSLTKFFSLAGLRIGYLVAPPKIVAEFEKKTPPWQVNNLAERASLAALADQDFIEKMPRIFSEERRVFFKSLSEIPFLKVFPGEANFLLLRIEHPELTSEGLKELLLSRGFLIRDASTFSGLSEKYVRLAVRRREENLALVRELREVFSKEEETFV